MHRLRFILFTLLISFLTGPALIAQQQATEENPQETEIIIIEETIDANGVKTINKTVKKGNFTDEEIDRIVDDASSEELFSEDSDNKGYLGVHIENSEEQQGVLVSQVVHDSPAADAGLLEGDLIKAVGGQEVNSIEELVGLVSSFEAGEEVDITYSRDGAPNNTSATLTSRSDIAEQKQHHLMEVEHEYVDLMESKPRRKLGVYIGHGSDEGVQLDDVSDDGIAKAAGIHGGDIIQSFDGKEVHTYDELVDAIQGAEAGKKILVQFIRDGETMSKEVEFDF